MKPAVEPLSRILIGAVFLFGLLTCVPLPCFAAEDVLEPVIWRYTTTKPADGWQSATLDDSQWSEGEGGFGTFGTPEARIGTVWSKPDIWLRRKLSIDPIPAHPALLVHHDEDAQVYLNGTKIADLQGYSTEYKVVPLDADAASAIRAGENLLAVHCHQTGGGQFIDVHLVDAENVPTLPPPNRQTKPFISDLTTEWGEQVTAANAWQVYPRPGMVRDQWINLNGMWDYAVTPQDQNTKPEKWDGQILVPFCMESKLSGVQRLLDIEEALWYHRTVDLTPQPNRRTLLNFEAVDYSSQVWVNDKLVGEHVGGNLPFTFDITGALRSGENEIVLRIEDETEGFQLHGKQSLNPSGIWYTRVSGIWQTVWIEQVPEQYVTELDIQTDAAQGTISVTPTMAGDSPPQARWVLEVFDGDRQVGKATGDPKSLKVKVEGAKLWSPASPHLYDLRLSLVDSAGNAIDSVKSYAGIRSVGKTQDADGNWRFTLNGEIIFHWGPLDQGWWPDGLLTPPSPEAMVFDIQFLKDAGFNMIRKHIKVEPRVYYYDCDRLGMLVWQDQVSGGRNPEWTRLAPNPRDAEWSDEHHAQFMQEFETMIDGLENHPCIVIWTPFNEAWGQHRTAEVGKWTEQRDPSRLVNIASGGNFWPVGDVADEHSYPHPNFPLDQDRFDEYVKVVGEFGGHGLPVEGHLWDADRDNWGYGGLPKNAAEYQERYRESIRRLENLKNQGIAAGVYTQTTDVEGEINGLMTYDRREIKIPAAELKQIHAPLTDSGTN